MKRKSKLGLLRTKKVFTMILKAKVWVLLKGVGIRVKSKNFSIVHSQKMLSGHYKTLLILTLTSAQRCSCRSCLPCTRSFLVRSSTSDNAVNLRSVSILNNSKAMITEVNLGLVLRNRHRLDNEGLMRMKTKILLAAHQSELLLHQRFWQAGYPRLIVNVAQIDQNHLLISG